MLSRIALALLPALSLATGAFAQTVYVVDAAGGFGADFDDIQAAVDVAGPLDRIEVRPGTYSPFSVHGAVTLIGSAPGLGARPDVHCPAVTVATVPAGETVVLADLSAASFDVLDCAGTIVADTFDVSQVQVERSDDVRLTGFGNFTSNVSRPSYVTAEESFVQMHAFGVRPYIAGYDENGRVGIDATDCEIILSDSFVRGEGGGDQSLCWGGITGEGGAAVRLRRSSLRAVGSELEGGEGGWDCFGTPSFLDGDAVETLDADSSVVTSDTTLHHAVTGPGSWTSPVGLPWIHTTGRPDAGGSVAFDFHAAAGSSFRLYLGRQPVVTRLAWLSVPILNSWDRGLSFGYMPAAGVVGVAWTVPALPPGTLVHVQTSATGANGGGTELSGACTLVVR